MSAESIGVYEIVKDKIVKSYYFLKIYIIYFTRFWAMRIFALHNNVNFFDRICRNSLLCRQTPVLVNWGLQTRVMRNVVTVSRHVSYGLLCAAGWCYTVDTLQLWARSLPLLKSIAFVCFTETCAYWVPPSFLLIKVQTIICGIKFFFFNKLNILFQI